MDNTRAYRPLSRVWLPLAFWLAIAVGSAAAATTPPVTPPPPATSATQATPADETPSVDDLPDVTTPIDYKSADAKFSAVFPSGCAKLRTRTAGRPGAPVTTDPRLIFCSCDRANLVNEGCSVAAHLGGARGLDAEAAKDKVQNLMRKMLETYGVVPAEQKPLRRDFGPHGVVEGLAIMAHPAQGLGDVHVRGLLHGEDIYILTAWKGSGDMASDEEYAVFFDSFRPWVDPVPKPGK